MASRYRVRLEGATPLLMHADNLTWRSRMEKWQADPEHKKLSRAGDDRTPAWRWLGNVYHDGKFVGIPSDNLMTMLREGGAKVPVPGKSSLTYKRQSQSGIVVDQVLWPIATAIGPVAWEPLAALQALDEYDAHETAVRAFGFELFAKTAKVGQSKHVRVRPRFDHWTAEGTITVLDETITSSVLISILNAAGNYCGIGDWRPSTPSKPGSWGRFVPTINKEA